MTASKIIIAVVFLLMHHQEPASGQSGPELIDIEVENVKIPSPLGETPHLIKNNTTRIYFDIRLKTDKRIVSVNSLRPFLSLNFSVRNTIGGNDLPVNIIEYDFTRNPSGSNVQGFVLLNYGASCSGNHLLCINVTLITNQLHKETKIDNNDGCASTKLECNKVVADLKAETLINPDWEVPTLRKGTSRRDVIEASFSWPHSSIAKSHLNFLAGLSKSRPCFMLNSQSETEVKVDSSDINMTSRVVSLAVTINIENSYNCKTKPNNLFLCVSGFFTSNFVDPNYGNNCQCFDDVAIQCDPDLSMDKFEIKEWQPGLIHKEQSNFTFSMSIRTDMAIGRGSDLHPNFWFDMYVTHQKGTESSAKGVDILSHYSLKDRKMELAKDVVKEVQGRASLKIKSSCRRDFFVCASVHAFVNATFDEFDFLENNTKCSTKLNVACTQFDVLLVLNVTWSDYTNMDNQTKESLKRDVAKAVTRKLRGKASHFVRGTVSQMQMSGTSSKARIAVWFNRKFEFDDATKINVSNILYGVFRQNPLLQGDDGYYYVLEIDRCGGTHRCSELSVCTNGVNDVICECRGSFVSKDQGQTCYGREGCSAERSCPSRRKILRLCNYCFSDRPNSETWFYRGIADVEAEWNEAFLSPLSELSKSVREEFPKVIVSAIQNDVLWRTMLRQSRVMSMSQISNGISMEFLCMFVGPPIPTVRVTKLFTRLLLNVAKTNTTLTYDKIVQVNHKPESHKGECLPPVDATASIRGHMDAQVSAMESGAIIGTVLSCLGGLMATFCGVVYWRESIRKESQLRIDVLTDDSAPIKERPQDSRFEDTNWQCDSKPPAEHVLTTATPNASAEFGLPSAWDTEL